MQRLSNKAEAHSGVFVPMYIAYFQIYFQTLFFSTLKWRKLWKSFFMKYEHGLNLS